MKSLVIRLLESSAVGRQLLRLVYVGSNKLKFWITSETQLVKKRFYQHHERYPDLDNPNSFAEKITWLKLYNRDELHTECADKYLVRDYVSRMIGEKYLVPLLGTFESLEDFTLETFDKNQTVIVKTNHDSKGGFIVDLTSQYDETKIKSNLAKRLIRNHYYATNEWQYLHIKPKIIVEKFLTNNGNAVDDFKLYCCNGKVFIIQHDTDRETAHRQNFYDRQWNPLDIQFAATAGNKIERPDNMSEMISLAEKLSPTFIFARIDFYIADSKIYFGEITFHPESGFRSFQPEHWDKKISDQIVI